MNTLAEKTTKNAKNAEKNSEETVAVPSQPPSIRTILETVDPKKIKMAENLGIPLTALFQYFEQQEAIQKAIISHLPDPQAFEKISVFVDKLNARMQNQPNQPPGPQQPQGGGGGSGWGEVLRMFAGGGGETSEREREYMDKMMALQFERLNQDVSFSRTMENYVKSQMAAKMAKNLTEGLE